MATPTRAVRLVPIGESPSRADLSAEEVEAYRVVEKTTVLVRTVAKYPQVRRNAATEAASRLYAHANFR